MFGGLSKFFSSRSAAKETGGGGDTGAPKKTCPEEQVTPWTLKVTVKTDPGQGQPHEDVQLIFSSGIAGETFKLSNIAVKNFTGTNLVDSSVQASTPGWALVQQERVVLKPGDDESIGLTIKQWKLHATVQSRHGGKFPAGNVTVGYAGSHQGSVNLAMASATAVAEFFNGNSANAPITLTLADPEWRAEVASPPSFAIAAPEDKSQTVYIVHQWKLTVNVTSDVAWWPEDDVTLLFPGGLRSQTGKLPSAPWKYEVTGFDDIDGKLNVTCPGWLLVGDPPDLKLRADTESTVNVKVAAWRIKVTVESTTAFGWPESDVTISIPNTTVPSKTLKMTAKTGFVHLDGYEEVKAGKLKAEVEGWTLEAEQEVNIKSGQGVIEMTLKLKGVDVVFELLDAATPPVAVAKEKVKVLRADGTDAPGAPTETDDSGLVKLTNVPPETYKIKLPDRYDAEWEFSKEEDA